MGRSPNAMGNRAPEDRTRRGGGSAGSWSRWRWWPALVVAAGIALAPVSPGNNGPQVAAPPTSMPSTTQPSTHHPAAPRQLRAPGVAGRVDPPTTAPAAPTAAGGPPVISSMTPSSGAAGQGIQVAGANFLSSSGEITATFNGAGGTHQLSVREHVHDHRATEHRGNVRSDRHQTANGTSNAVTFTYSWTRAGSSASGHGTRAPGPSSRAGAREAPPQPRQEDQFPGDSKPVPDVGHGANATRPMTAPSTPAVTHRPVTEARTDVGNTREQSTDRGRRPPRIRRGCSRGRTGVGPL